MQIYSLYQKLNPISYDFLVLFFVPIIFHS